MSKFVFIVIASAIVAAAGCTHTPKSAREQFLSSVGSARTNYVQLYEVSIEGLKFLEDDVYSKVSNTLIGVEASATNCTTVQDKIKGIRRVAQLQKEHKLSLIQQLNEGFDPTSDSVLFYHRVTSTHQEFGWLVVSNGRVKRKVILGEGRVLREDEL